MAERTTRYAVVTGANKGIGYAICKQLASNGVTVVLTARDEKRGLAAVEKLKEYGVGDYIVFHQLDVVDLDSIISLADFIKTKFGRLDILVNNAGVSGYYVDPDTVKAAGFGKEGVQGDYSKLEVTQTYETIEECMKINYYGAKMMCEVLIPLLNLSDAPRIVNVSSGAGKLKNLSPDHWATQVLSDGDNLTVEKVDEVASQFLKDAKDNVIEAKGWPSFVPPYTVSKAALNGYTRALAKEYTNILTNCVCPGSVMTDLNFNGQLTTDEGAEIPVKLALLPNDGPSGRFFHHKEDSPY